MAPILINKDMCEPSYNDLKFTVQNCNYICTNLIALSGLWKVYYTLQRYTKRKMLMELLNIIHIYIHAQIIQKGESKKNQRKRNRPQEEK